jgi:hypothetical protein
MPLFNLNFILNTSIFYFLVLTLWFLGKGSGNLWSTDTSIIKRVSVSDTCWCPTLVWHSYDTCRMAHSGVGKNSIFPLLWHSFERCLTPVRHLYGTCRTSVSKKFIFSLLIISLGTYQTYLQKLKICRNNNIDRWEIEDITFWLQYF